jgi:hypothetical protein
MIGGTVSYIGFGVVMYLWAYLDPQPNAVDYLGPVVTLTILSLYGAVVGLAAGILVWGVSLTPGTEDAGMGAPRIRLTLRSWMVVVGLVAIISWACVTFWRALPYMITWDEPIVTALPPDKPESPSAPDGSSPTPRVIGKR